ncbi:Putative peroxiredoxin [Maioricimonas rarisocia]|uniref:Peroxiredoxin n=1 Tax=Maioricimonas rarisocia TaxID=2528026 RepID=A0A517Z6M1_9PLAN|nr:redoxin domain-containing protein [Maioricimonas rarisocia]QDU38142.1 Putative peroxiredoxin [Maioricimonas rarisocia]
MRPRILILPIAAIVIGGLVFWRLNREERSPSGARSVALQLAPRFELYDQSSRLVKFERYLGRTRMAVVFFDGDAGADQNALLRTLQEHHDAVEQAGVQIIGISTATPYANRAAGERAGGEFPFPLLSDVDLARPVHRQWGMVNLQTGEPKSGLFLVDRGGRVAAQGGEFVPVSDPDSVVAELAQGRWPGAMPE